LGPLILFKIPYKKGLINLFPFLPEAKKVRKGLKIFFHISKKFPLYIKGGPSRGKIPRGTPFFKKGGDPLPPISLLMGRGGKPSRKRGGAIGGKLGGKTRFFLTNEVLSTPL